MAEAGSKLQTSMTRLTAFLIGTLLLSGTTVAGSGAADDSSACFSIHVASFQNLKNANAFVNSLQGQGKVVFWKGVQVKEKGYFYRIFTGRYKSYAQAERDWALMKSKGQVSYKGIFSFQELLPGKALKGAKDISKTPSPDPAKKKKGVGATHARFVDNHDGTVTDRHSGLMWLRNGWHGHFFSALTWENAIDKCSRFEAAGYTDWTLPTKAQWQSLLDDHQQAPAIADPNPFRNVIIHMPYWSRNGPFQLLSHRYIALLYSGRIKHQQKTEMAFVWPVREVR